MPLDEGSRDWALLTDMLKFAQEALFFVSGVLEADYQHDLMRQRATERSLQNVGEAASKVSRLLRDAHPELPWREVIGLRHRLAHDYEGIQAERIWEITQGRLPALVLQLERIVRASKSA